MPLISAIAKRLWAFLSAGLVLPFIDTGAGFRHVIATWLDLGYSESEVRKMVSSNAADLAGLE